MEEDSEPNKLPVDDKPISKAKPIYGIAIVGYNLLGLAAYTLLFKVLAYDGVIQDAFILLFHVIVCLGMALDRKSWIWLLSALLVLAIGFSTCVMVGAYNA